MIRIPGRPRSRDTAPGRTTSRTPRRFPRRPRPRRPRRARGGGCRPARGRPRPARGTGSAGSRCGSRRAPCPTASRAPARTRAGRARDSSASRHSSGSACGAPPRAPSSARAGRIGGLGADVLGQSRRAGRRAVRAQAGRSRGPERPRRGNTGAGAARRCRGAPARRRRGRRRAGARGAGAPCWGAGRGGRRGPGRDSGRGGAGQLLVHRVAGLVAQRLQHLELIHRLDRSGRRAYFQDRSCINRRHGSTLLDTPDPDDPGAPVHEPVAGPPPSGADVRQVLRGVIDPELHASIVDLGMVDDVTRRRRRHGRRQGRAHHRRLPAARPDQAATSSRRSRGLPGVARRQGRLRRDDPGAEDRGDAARPLERPRERAPHRGRRDHTGAGDRERQGRRRQVVGHGQPRGRARRAWAARSACSTPTSGASASRACSGRRPPRRHRRQDHAARAQRLERARRRTGRLEGRVDGLPRRRRGHRADVARPHPHQGARAVPHRRALGRARLPADRHAARHRRHPDGPRPHAPAGRDARRHHTRARRAEGRGPRRRHGAPLVHEGRRAWSRT